MEPDQQEKAFIQFVMTSTERANPVGTATKWGEVQMTEGVARGKSEYYRKSNDPAFKSVKQASVEVCLN